MIQVETYSSVETAEFAKCFGELLKAGDILALDGDLGTGKTVFSKGIAKALNITEPVTSPTFIIMQEYKSGKIPLYHFDVYRIEDPEELYEIGADEYMGGDGICLIEWASVIRDILPPDIISILIEKNNTMGFDYRLITITGLEQEEENDLQNRWKYNENTCN